MYNKKNIKKYGFTLVELLVTISIMAIISATLFWNGNQFNDKLSVSTVAEDVSLIIRNAQSYSSSVREASAGTGQFGYGYGVDFDTTNTGYVITFLDVNGNKAYDVGDTLIQKNYLRNGVVIGSICVTDSSNTESCSASYKSLQISFIRPSLNATISTVDGGGAITSSWVSGKVNLVSPQGVIKSVSVNSFGQISIQ